MTIECVDGQMATPHITGAQKGAIHAGVFGSGSYVLATGNQCKATQNSATSVTIGTGDLIIHGRHHQIVSAETVTIQSGTQGQKRNDLICAVYHRDAQGIEQPTVTVLKGTPTTGTPADPTVPSGNVLNGDAVDYFPLYRVSLNGTTASAPVRLFKVSPTLATLGDSVSRAPRLVVGSKSFEWAFSGTLAPMLTASEFRSVAGRRFDWNRDCVCLMNASWADSKVERVGAVYQSSDDTVYASCDPAPGVGRWVRINYAIALG